MHLSEEYFGKIVKSLKPQYTWYWGEKFTNFTQFSHSQLTVSTDFCFIDIEKLHMNVALAAIELYELFKTSFSYFAVVLWIDFP